MTEREKWIEIDRYLSCRTLEGGPCVHKKPSKVGKCGNCYVAKEYIEDKLAKRGSPGNIVVIQTSENRDNMRGYIEGKKKSCILITKGRILQD